MSTLNPTTGKDYDTDPSPLASMSHSQLTAMRNQTTDPLAQALIAPYEHRAYARETVQSDPGIAPLMSAVLIPGYQAFKGLGLGTNDGDNIPRTPPSWEQFKQGQIGTGEGLYEALARKLQSP